MIYAKKYLGGGKHRRILYLQIAQIKKKKKNNNKRTGIINNVGNSDSRMEI